MGEGLGGPDEKDINFDAGKEKFAEKPKLGETEIAPEVETPEDQTQPESAVTPEQKERAKELAAVTSIVFSTLGTPRHGEEDLNASIAMSQGVEIDNILRERNIEVPSELIIELQSLFSKIKEEHNFGVVLNADVIDIIEKMLANQKGFENVGFEERVTPTFLENTMIKALGGKKAAPKIIGSLVGQALIGKSDQEVLAAFHQLRDVSAIVQVVHALRWESGAKEASGPNYIESAPSEASTVLEKLEHSGFSLEDIKANPLTVEDMLGLMDIEQNWLKLTHSDQVSVLHIMNKVAEKYGAKLVSSSKGPVITI